MRPFLRALVFMLAAGALCLAQAPTDPPAPAVAAARQATNLAILPIEGPIDLYTALSIDRRLRLAEASGADAVVIELDTPGGEVGAVLEICNALKSTTLGTTAWVNQDAYSGGAIIALACQEIVVAPYATMGDAAPISMNPVTFAQGLQRTERQKILQPLISEVVDSARRRGYDERLVQAFLTLGIELWLIEHAPSGRRVFVSETQFTDLFGTEPPRDAVRAPSGATPGVEAAAGDPLDPEIRSAVEQAQELPPTVPDLSGEDPAEWTLVEYATDGESLLTLKTEDLQRFGFAAAVIPDEAALAARFGAVNVTRVEPTWSERMVSVMTSMWVRGVLIAIFLVAAFVELIAPGFGFPGLVALGALALLFGPPALVGAAAWWALVAVVGGVLLLLAEVLILPGFGFFGIGGLIALFVGLVGAVIGPGPLFPDSPDRSQDLLHGLATVLVSGASAGVAMFYITRYHGSLPLLNKLVLTAQSGDTLESEELITANPRRSHAPSVALGDIGVATTTLRPSGTAEFDGRLVDVVAGLGMIDAGQRVRVSEVDGVRVVVDAEERAVNEVFLLWGFGLFALAGLILVLELFIPSGGLLGALSGIAAIAGVVSFFRFSTGWGLTALGALIVLAPVSVSLLLKVWPHTPVGRRMILGSPGSESAELARSQALAREQERLDLEALVGQHGEALTDLRPVGEIRIGAEHHEAIALGPALERGAAVRVVDVDGSTLKVRQA